MNYKYMYKSFIKIPKKYTLIQIPSPCFCAFPMFEMLQVRENEILLRKWSAAIAYHRHCLLFILCKRRRAAITPHRKRKSRVALSLFFHWQRERCFVPSCPMIADMWHSPHLQPWASTVRCKLKKNIQKTVGLVLQVALGRVGWYVKGIEFVRKVTNVDENSSVLQLSLIKYLIA